MISVTLSLACTSSSRFVCCNGRIQADDAVQVKDGHGWKLNRSTYYQEGWLATGNSKGTIGVTFTTTLGQRSFDSSSASLISFPARTNYNLRGHRSQVCLVRWNEPYQKLATCDTSGIIFVWIRYEGRWSIELINDRNTPVTHFSWSHDGRMALIAYQDGFVLVGSVAGQRYWSTMLNQESSVTAGAWTPDDQQVYLATSNGGITVLDVHNGSIMAQVHVTFDSPIRDLAWNCPRFKMEEPSSPPSTWPSGSAEEQYILGVLTENGRLILMKGYDDLTPTIVETNLNSTLIEWNNSGKVICAAGQLTRPSSSGQYSNAFKFFTSSGTLRYFVPFEYTQAPITGLTWGHNDRRLFVATGNLLHVAWVSRKIPSLQHLSRLAVRCSLLNAIQLDQMQLPSKLSNLVAPLFCNTVQSNKLEVEKLNEFVCQPPPGNTRLYCTMIRRDEECVSDNNNELDNTAGYSQLSCGLGFTLYLEFLGGLIPLLKGKPTSKIRPDFVITEPYAVSKPELQLPDTRSTSSPRPVRKMRNDPELSDSGTEDSCVSTPRLQRRWKRSKTANDDHERNDSKVNELTAPLMPPLSEVKLAEVASNIWGTKFKIHGSSPHLPEHLGYVTYKTSLLHLQPRQMTLAIVDLREPPLASEDKQKYASEDEEEGSDELFKEEFATRSPPIAPSSPNIRLRSGDERRTAEPPPSPTHQLYQRPKRSGIEAHIDDVLRVELNSDRVVLSPVQRCRSFSVGHLDCVLGCSVSADQSVNGTSNPYQWRHKNASVSVMRRKSRSLDSSPAQCDRPQPSLRRSWAVQVRQQQAQSKTSLRSTQNEANATEKRCPLSRLSPLLNRKFKGSNSGNEPRKFSLKGGTNEAQRGSSEPATPNCSPLLQRKSRTKHSSPIRQLLSSPLLGRKFRRGKFQDNSDEEFANEQASDGIFKGRSARADIFLTENYEDLESFQKAQLLSKALLSEKEGSKRAETPVAKPKRREYILHNKAPLWNEHSQVYQLDFGGRVTQESAKNFQIEFKGKQVMQFGRIDGNAYTLDFQYPFSAVQAFAVALANVTQRLK